MHTEKMISRVEDGRTLVLERTFEAPQELVFWMFGACEHLKQWWGPQGWELPVCRMDVRPGGERLYCMKCVDEDRGEFYGMESWGMQVYREIA